MTQPHNWHTKPQYNPFWASDCIHAQCLINGRKGMICLAFTEEEEQLLVDVVRESPHDYRITVTDGASRSYESRKGTHITTAYEDGLWHPRHERMEVEM